MMNDLLKKIQTETSKDRNLLFDIWAGDTLVSKKSEFTATEMEQKISDLLQESEYVRVRMYWSYGNQPPRFMQEFSIIKSAGSSMNGIKDDDDIYDEDFQQPVRQNAPRRATNNSFMKPMSMNGDNPLSWILQEKTEQLREVKEKYSTAKATIETLRSKNEQLERELIKKDHEIDNLSGEVEGGKGLAGFAQQNPDIASKVVESIGNVAAVLMGKALPAAPQTPAYEGTAQDVAEWLMTLNEDDQAYMREIVIHIGKHQKANPQFISNFYQSLNNQQNVATG